MEQEFEKIETKEGVIKIYQDCDLSESPREWDNFGRMVCFHKNYNLGDKHDLIENAFESWEDTKEYLIKEKKAEIILPLYLYDHSGITISVNPFNCRWDSGQIGFIYVTKEDIKKNFEVKAVTKKILERAKKVLIGEVETYDQYLRGDVYGYVTEDKEGEQIDSCWGYYGIDYEENGLMAQAKDSLKRRQKEIKVRDKKAVTETEKVMENITKDENLCLVRGLVEEHFKKVIN